MPFRRPPQLASDRYVGPVRIFYTMCVFGRRSAFDDPSVVTLVLRELLRTARECGVEIVAYCFMPDHVHFLAEGLTAASDTARCIRLFRQRTGLLYRRTRGDRLWQEGFFDRVLRSDDDTLGVVRYIVGNPVRAGLCDAVERFPFSGAGVYSLAEIASAVQWSPRR